MELQKFTQAEKEQLMASAKEHILIHWASNEDLAKDSKIFTAGEGCYIYDIDGKKYLDSFSSLITTICGHHRPEVKEAILEQMKYLEFFPNYHDTYNIPLIKLSEKLAELLPGDLDVCFYICSGSEANETAIKMARQYYWQTGQKQRYKVISRKNSYHGTTIAAASYTGFKGLREFLEPTVQGCLFAPAVNCWECEMGCEASTCGMACLKEMERMIKWEGPETVAAVIMDPIPGSNSGYPIPPDGYLQGVRDLCDKYGIMLIFDEVQTGFGKTGKWFACDNWGVVPDMMSISKALSAGFAPIGVTVTSKKIADVFNKDPGSEFRSGSTYGGHPIACTVALAVLGIIEKENLVEQALEKGKYIKSELEKLKKYDIVADIRGLGTLWAIELRADRVTKAKLDPSLKVGSFIRDWCWENGMILRNNGDLLVIAPAIVMSKDEIDIMIGNVDKAISAAIEKFGL